MLYFWFICLILLNSLWLALTFLALPGNWLIVISTCLFAWWRADDGIFSIYTLLAITILAVGGELVEFLAGPGGAKKAGAGWLGAIAAIFGAAGGAVIGTLLLPVPLLGTLIGACIGAGLAVWAVELTRSGPKVSPVRTGFGAGLGVLVGMTGKLFVGALIWLIVALAAFWP